MFYITKLLVVLYYKKYISSCNFSKKNHLKLFLSILLKIWFQNNSFVVNAKSLIFCESVESIRKVWGYQSDNKKS